MKTCTRLLLILSATFLVPRAANAQSSDHDAVMATLERFFEGFAAGDSTRMFQHMDRGGRLVLTSNDAIGRPQMETFGAEQFIRMLSQPRQQPIREEIANPQIRIVDNLAAVWVDYNVYVGDQIDHCGVDHFQLFRGTDGWKIIATADTQRRTGCVPFN